MLSCEACHSFPEWCKTTVQLLGLWRNTTSYWKLFWKACCSSMAEPHYQFPDCRGPFRKNLWVFFENLLFFFVYKTEYFPSVQLICSLITENLTLTEI